MMPEHQIRKAQAHTDGRECDCAIASLPVPPHSTPSNLARFFLSNKHRTNSFTNGKHGSIAKDALVRTSLLVIILLTPCVCSIPPPRPFPPNPHPAVILTIHPSLSPSLLPRRMGLQDHHPARPLPNRGRRTPRGRPPPSPSPREQRPLPLRCC